MKVRAHYSLLNTIPVEKDPALPDLEPLIARWHGKRIRRIDRYIQLCIAGGLNCVGEQKLAPCTGLYLASRVGAVTTSAKVMNNIGQWGEMPKPLHFVNTLGNSAGYYLTQLLGLTGNTLVLSQEHLSFEAALLHAWIDLSQGRIARALVGGFDEVPIPMEHHLERLRAPWDAPAMIEGSHWLLLDGESGGDSQFPVALSCPEWLRDQHALGDWLASQSVPALIQTSFVPTDEEALLLAQTGAVVSPFTRPGVPHGVFSGAALVALCETLEEQPDRDVLHLSRGDGEPYCAVRVG